MTLDPNFEVIAQRSLLLAEPNQLERKSVTVKLGRPYWVEEGIEAACPVVIEGMLRNRSDIRGTDLFDAVESAIRFVNLYLAGCDPGQELYWIDGEPYREE